MFSAATDRAWKSFGKTDPYFGVLVEERFRSTQLTDQSLSDFFLSGEQYVEAMTERIGRRFNRPTRFRRALDFGCGVGRLLMPLARLSDEAVGVDVSPGMLAEAADNCRRRGLDNVALAASDDRLAAVQGTFDLVHTYIVLQHIPVRRGMRVIAALLDRLDPGGVGVLHMTYAKAHWKWRAIGLVKKYVPLAHRLTNLRRGRPWSAPRMQMNDYDLNRVLGLLQRAGVHDVDVQFTDHGGFWGAALFFQKP